MEVYRHWDRNRIHRWNDRSWRWSGGTWVIVDSAPSVTYSHSSGSLAARVQDALNDRGYNAGPEDGVIGPRTRDAISDYQADRGLNVTGRIDTALVRSLGL